MGRFIYLDGELVSVDTAAISPFDHGFLYGHGLFETMRIYGGKVFRLDAHLERLEHGAKVLGWTELPPREELIAAIYALLSANKLSEASVRLTVSRGAGAARPDASTCGRPTVVVFAIPFQPLGSEIYEQGWKLATVSICRNQTSPLSRIKSANYLDNMLARDEARRQGANDALMLNTIGQVTEGTVCNLFFVTGGILVTPDVASGILPGITRAVVLQAAIQAGISVEERPVVPKELVDADEVFITGSLLEIMPVTCLDNRVIGNGYPGEFTLQLIEKYKRVVQCECR